LSFPAAKVPLGRMVSPAPVAMLEARKVLLLVSIVILISPV